MALESYGVLTAISPACEWSYEQLLPDGVTQRIPFSGCAGSDTDLVRQVRDFRVGQNISLDNLEDDIATYIKTHSPQNNRFPNRANPAHPPRVARSTPPLIERISAWTVAMQPKQPRLLSEDDAERRSEICAGCPQNVQWKVKCAPCVDTVIQRGRHLRQRVDYPKGDALKACRLQNFYLPAAVFIDRDALGDAHPEAPEFCWMRTEAISK